MKKGQIQSGESITVVIIVVIIIVVGIVFATNLQIGGIEEEAQTRQEIDAMQIALKTVGLSELKCTQFSSTGTQCIDYYKAKALSKALTENQENSYEEYYQIFLNSKIEIEKIYPEEETITIYDFAPTEAISQQLTNIPINIYDPVKDQTYFGILKITAYN